MPTMIRSINRNQWVHFFTHFIVILIIFFLPDMMMNYGRRHHSGTWEWMVYLKSFLFVGLFYLNYYVIIKRSLFGEKRRVWAFVGYNLLFIFLVLLIMYVIQRMAMTPARPRRNELPAHVLLIREWSFFLRDFVMMILAIALSLILKFTGRWTAMEKHHEEMLVSQREDELRNLRSQLNPHFLFNTLNTIYSLIDISPRDAQDAIHRLSRLLRYMLYENPSTVRLAQEVEFARMYISLMELRLGEGCVKTDFTQIHGSDVNVAPLLFISVIENAFKHGYTGKHQPIEISLGCTADGVVTCRTFNHFISRPDDGERTHSGIGLQNLSRRLHLIYGDKASLTTQVVDDTYTALITIDTKP